MPAPIRSDRAPEIPARHHSGYETAIQRPMPLSSPLAPPEPSYYDIPMLKKPVWSGEIGCYFYLGGLSAGSYVLARLAERFGGETYQPLTRTGTAVATVALLPCPPLLIADLGDWSRFHHMLRVFKPRSPMSLGSWLLTGYSGILFLTALREWLGGRHRSRRRPWKDLLFGAVDAAGLPTALMFSGYTGVLLSGTATPVWSKNPWLGPLFTASAISNAASAISGLLQIRADEEREERTRPSVEALEKIDTAGHIAEIVTLTGYLSTAGTLAKPLTHGRIAPLFWGAAAGIVAGEVLHHLRPKRKTRHWLGLAAAIVGVAGGFALKWAVQQAGPPSAADPAADRQASRRSRPEIAGSTCADTRRELHSGF